MDAETLIRRESARQTEVAAATATDDARKAGVQRLARAVIRCAVQDGVEDERAEKWLHSRHAQTWAKLAGLGR